MSANRQTSIYILVSLLIIVGILLFLLRSYVLSYVSQRVFGPENLLAENVPAPSASANIDVKVTGRSDFKKLSNQVTYFDFNVVGKPAPKNTNLSIPNWPSTYKGNFNPFFKEPVKTETANAQ